MIDLDGLTPFEASKEYAEATKALARMLINAGTIPAPAVPGWVAGACVTALVEELRDEELS